MNQNNIKRKYAGSFVSIIILLFILNCKSIGQWQNTNLPSFSTVNTLAICDSIIFAGTDGDGIFKSTDEGNTWISINNGLQSKVVHNILIDSIALPLGKHRIFAGTELGASLSTDDGESWTTINSGLSDVGVWSFVLSYLTPGNPILFAGTWSGIYSSTDNGLSWKAAGLQSVLLPVHSFLINKQLIYAATAGSGLFISKNNGESWYEYPLYNIGSQFDADSSIIPVYSISKINSNVVIGIGYGYLDYIPVNTTKFITSDHYPFRGYPIMSFFARDEILYGCTTGGDILLTKTYGYDWESLSPSLTNHAIYSLLLSNNYVFAGTESGVWRLPYPATTTNVDKFKETPTGFALEQNYPNPFNPSTRIKFTIPHNSMVSLKVYNVLGKLVDDLVDKYMLPGTYEVEFSGNNLPSGVYFYSLVTNEFRDTKKFVLLK